LPNLEQRQPCYKLAVWHKQRHDLHDDPRFAALVKKMGFSEAKP
jgi:hypothetical protein